MESHSQTPNNGEVGVIWLLPELRGDRSEPVLEMRHDGTINAEEIGKVNPLPPCSQANMANSIGWYVFFSQPNESPEFVKGFEDVSGLKNMFSLSSEPSTVNVFRECPKEDNYVKKGKEPIGEMGHSLPTADKRVPPWKLANELVRVDVSDHSDMEMQELEIDLEDVSGLKNVSSNEREKEKFRDEDEYEDDEGLLVGGSLMDMRMEQWKSGSKNATNVDRGTEKGAGIEMMFVPDYKSELPNQRKSGLPNVSILKHELVEQEQGPNKDFNLLDAYRSMEDNVVYDRNDIYEQSTPLGNTVLHLAASLGNEWMVEKVSQHAPRLFTAVNSNGDTALHIAARTGHGSIVKSLLNKFLLFVRSKTSGHGHKSILETMLMVSLTLYRNKQGNTFLHEAFNTSSHNGAAIFKAFQDPFITDGDSDQFEAIFKKVVNHLAAFAVNMEEKSLLYLTIEANCEQVVNQLMDFCIQGELKPQGKSPLLPALINNKPDMLKTILSTKPNWVHLRNEQGWLPLHHAALLGCLQGVSYLVQECPSCTMERDNKGSLPIHLACIQGHVKIVQELMKYCLDIAGGMVNNDGQNLLHLACSYRNYDLVRYLLDDPKHGMMINQKDFEGNTPLHLATISWHPRIVHDLTWDNRINLSLLNNQYHTALDTAEVYQDRTVSLAQRLTWNALVSAGTPRSSVRFYLDDGKKKISREPYTTEHYKDRIDTLVVVSTLIVTISFAAGFTFPGDVENGIPVLINRRMFHLFISTLTISVFGAISSTIILMWARLGDLHLAVFALSWAIPLLGLSLTMLSLAFWAGIYLIVMKISWLATTFLVIGAVLILVVVFLYLLLLLPTPSAIPFFRYISYYPFLFFSKIAEGKMDANKMGSKAIIHVL